MITIENVKESEYTEDIMIKATRSANIGTTDLIEEFNRSGLIGVYNLGLKHMLDYIRVNE